MSCLPAGNHGLRPGESFQQRLQRLRIRSTRCRRDSAHLIDLAETIARQHRQLQNRVSHTMTLTEPITATIETIAPSPRPAGWPKSPATN